MTKNTLDPVEFAKALADETRQEIMRLCCCCWLNVGEIVAALKVTQPTVSHHLAILKAADLVQTRREGKQVYYTLNQQKIASGCCTLAEDFAPDHELSLTSREPENFFDHIHRSMSIYLFEGAIHMDAIENSDEVRAHVRQHYAGIAEASQRGEMVGCCSPSQGCCSPGDSSVTPLIALDAIQEHAPNTDVLSLGCGDPLFGFDLKEGQTVLDLGSGAGLDCLRAARKVGRSGWVIGVDMTPEMLRLARANQANAGLDNVEFRLGEIEHLPVADASVDVVISNCVINLSPDKPQVFREIHRVLRAGGRLAVSDIVTDGPLSETVRQSLSAWASCVAGALDVEDYQAAIEAAGFDMVEVEQITFDGEVMDDALGQLNADQGEIARDDEAIASRVFSARISAIKR